MRAAGPFSDNEVENDEISPILLGPTAAPNVPVYRFDPRDRRKQQLATAPPRGGLDSGGGNPASGDGRIHRGDGGDDYRLQ